MCTVKQLLFTGIWTYPTVHQSLTCFFKCIVDNNTYNYLLHSTNNYIINKIIMNNECVTKIMHIYSNNNENGVINECIV